MKVLNIYWVNPFDRHNLAAALGEAGVVCVEDVEMFIEKGVKIPESVQVVFSSNPVGDNFFVNHFELNLKTMQPTVREPIEAPVVEEEIPVVEEEVVPVEEEIIPEVKEEEIPEVRE